MVRILFYTIITFACLSCAGELNGPDSPEKSKFSPLVFNENENLEGWIRIKFNRESFGENTPALNGDMTSDTGIPLLNEVIKQLGAIRAERVFSDGGKFRRQRREAGLHLWYDFYIGDTVPLTRASLKLSDMPGIEVVEAVPLYKQAHHTDILKLNTLASLSRSFAAYSEEQFPFNDPDLHLQHHFQNPGIIPGFVAGADINLFPAWNKTTGDPSVIVAILDGGIDITHPDLAGNIWINEDEYSGISGEDDDDNGYPDDIYGWRFGYISGKDTLLPSGEIIPMDHGTHCAGIIGAVNNNGIGGGGIAGGTNTQRGVRLMCCQTFIPDPAHPAPNYSHARSTGKADEALLYAAENGAVIASCSFSSTSFPESYKAAIDYFVSRAGIDSLGNQTGPMRGGIVICAAGNENNATPKYPAAYKECISVAYIAPDYKKSQQSNYGSWIDLSAPGGSVEERFGTGPAGAVYSTLPIGSPNGIREGYGYLEGSSMACPHVAGIAALVVSRFGGINSGFTSAQLTEILRKSVRDITAYNPEYSGKLGSGLTDATLALRTDEGIAPEAVKKIITTWMYNAVELQWNSTRDQNYLPVAAYELFWSTAPLSGFDPENPGEGIHKITIDNTVPIGGPIPHTLSELSEKTRYYLAIVATDEYDNRSLPYYFSGSTNSNIPPMIRSEAECKIYLEHKGKGSLDLNDFFYDPNEEEITFRISTSDKHIMNITLDGPILSYEPLKNGLCRITVTATDQGMANGKGELLFMVRESKEAIDLYPNPVKDLLHLRMGKESKGNASVKVYNSAGRQILSTGIYIDPFEPASLNLSSLSGGSYIIIITINGHPLKRHILKY